MQIPGPPPRPAGLEDGDAFQTTLVTLVLHGVRESPPPEDRWAGGGCRSKRWVGQTSSGRGEGGNTFPDLPSIPSSSQAPLPFLPIALPVSLFQVLSVGKVLRAGFRLFWPLLLEGMLVWGGGGGC